MSEAALVLVSAMFLILIPVNLSVALEVNGIAGERPRNELLVLVARLVTVLAFAACVAGLFSTLSVLRFLTGTIILPQPLAALIFVVSALGLSSANLLVRRYLRQKRGGS